VYMWLEKIRMEQNVLAVRNGSAKRVTTAVAAAESARSQHPSQGGM
jgi:hypothetical protein